MANIFVTRKLPGTALDRLTEQHKVDIFPESRPISTDELKAGIQHADVLICLLTDSIDAKIISAGSHLKIIANYAVGYNNIDVDWATLRNIAVLNTPGVLTEASADMTFALLLAAARRVQEGDQLIRKGQWCGWEPEQLLGLQVSGKTLGIVGMGRIGVAVAQRAKGFGLRIVYNNPQPLPSGQERDLGAKYVSLAELLAQSDFVSLHCPLTPNTRHLINANTLAQMKQGAILINTARGAIVDETALVHALKNKHLFAAALDVFESEPRVRDALLEMPQVVLTPHLGSATVETRHEMAMTLVRGILMLFQKQIPHNIVNPEVLGSMDHASLTQED